jgi:uncharacterized repeat protein (TIGR01451 family)
MKHHYKKILIAFFFSMQFSFLNAQWVTIPDSNFVNWLNANGYASCMNGNLMDTTCNAVVSATQIDCSNSSIISLEGIQYFYNLYNLVCSNNQLIFVPNLSTPFLIDFDCSYNQLSSLPIFILPPNNFALSIICNNNFLSYLPFMPNTLTELICNNNLLTSLPPLPNGLNSLDCSSNSLNSLPLLSDSLHVLYCENNQLTSLPFLPSLLTYLNCSNNLLLNLPVLPNSLNWLGCSFNQLTSLPALPNTFGFNLFCIQNQLTSLPELPDVMSFLAVNSNPNLFCLPKLKQINDLSFAYTGVQCLPNYGSVASSNPPLSSVPLCNLFNTNGCNFYWNINGQVYGDANNNCIADNNELRLSNMKLMLDSAGTLIQQTYTGGEGFYSFDTDTGTYTYTVDTIDLPVLVTCPAAGFQTSVLTAVDSMDYDMDFGMQCKAGFDVGVTSVARDSGVFRPAHFARVKIAAGDISNFYGLHCAAGTGGSVQVVFSGGVSYVGTTAGALTPVVSGDTLLYSIADFGTVNYNADFSFTMQTDTSAAIGSTVCFDVNVTPTTGDINPANNSLHYCFTVVNTFDPNTKEVFPEGNIDTSQHWLTYTINFQNTGTAPAQHIYVLDTLDNSLDESSFTLLSYSFQPLTQVLGKVIRFNFPNINLPDSTSDEPHSHGYVQYKLKIKPGLTNGTLIHNTADIVFDFNTPVITNTVINQVHITTGTDNFQFSTFNFQFSPNPFHNSTLLKIISPMKSGNYTLEIYNVIGEKMREINCLNKSEIVIERNNLEAGIYIFKLFNERELMGTGKLVVE